MAIGKRKSNAVFNRTESRSPLCHDTWWTHLCTHLSFRSHKGYPKLLDDLRRDVPLKTRFQTISLQMVVRMIIIILMYMQKHVRIWKIHIVS